MQQLVLVIQILVTLSLIALVLVQHGKGADVGASFGSGAANTMFGSTGPASFLMKLTGILAAVFFATSIGLGYLLSHQTKASTFNFKQPVSQPATTTPAQPSGSSEPKQESKPVTFTPPVSNSNAGSSTESKSQTGTDSAKK